MEEPAGYVFRDGGAVPDSDLTEAQRQEKNLPGNIHSSEDQPLQTGAASLAPGRRSSKDGKPSSHEQKLRSEDGPTDSHVLAAASHEEVGAAQEEHFHSEVKDLGWRDDRDNLEKRIVGGIRNEELWLLIRRFNKQMYHVKATEEPILAGLDLNIADEDEFSPDKLRANVERLYMTVIVGMISFGKHIARLRSWREPRRTGAFAAVYLVAWVFDFVMPILFTVATVLIMVPGTRALLFPPAPIALVDSKTGGIKKPKVGVLGSHDSVTGAPENHQGEAVEQEASNFVAGIGTIALSSATGKHEPEGSDADPLSKRIPDPSEIGKVAGDAKGSAQGEETTELHDKTKQPMEQAMWSQMRPVMHVIGDIADGWERFGNALSPTSPFPKFAPKLKLAAVVAPGILISMITSSYLFMKLNFLITGFVFFGDPVMQRGLELLNRKIPNWQKLLELRNSILKGIPTNAQLTVTLLRVGEANRAPLPPPPRAGGIPPEQAAELDVDELPISDDPAEIHDAIHPDRPEASEADAASETPSKKKGSKVLSFLKGTTKVGVETKLESDTVRAAAGSKHAKDHLGAVPKQGYVIESGPVDFRGRFNGKRGWVYINTSATVPCVGFSTHKSKGTGEDTEKELNPIFSIPIEDIRELKKVGGFGWKAKIVVGWATSKNVLDGLEIIDKKGVSTKITAVALRDELFNRLVAMGAQKWESW